MSKCGRWAWLMGMGVLTSGCDLALEGRACGLSGTSEEGQCMEGYSCCEGNTCQKDCSGEPESMPPGEAPPAQNPTAEPPFASLDMALGDTRYSYFCDRGASSISEPGQNGGMGPTIDTASSACPWPADNPRLWVSAKFRDFLPSQGLPVGTWDLADPETVFPVRVTFIGSRGGEPLVGRETPYQYYESTAPIEGVEPPPSVIRDGFYQSPLATGTIAVSLLSSMPTLEDPFEDFGSDGMTNIYLIELSNVTLGASSEFVSDPDDPFPTIVTIKSAAVTYELE